MNTSTVGEWAEHIEHLARPVIDRLDVEAEWGVARSRERHLAGPLMAHVLKREMRAPEAVTARPKGIEDVFLWWGLTDATVEPLHVVDLDAEGCLFDSAIGQTYATIEVWTETELAGLHALSHYVDETERGRQIADRIGRAVEWHIENTQPDNATNHPWALHVFLKHGTPESRHFAETLLSNCQVRHAEPDPLSAFILLDAAAELTT